MRRGRQRDYSITLTDSQKELLPYLAADKSNKQIADEMGVSYEAIINRVIRLTDKARCLDRAELVIYAKQYMTEQGKET